MFRPVLMTALALSTLPAAAQIAPKPLTASQTHETLAQRDARMNWWREARFGLFIHWNPSSLKGTEISISRSPNPYGPNPGGIPAEEYDSLYKQFNPTNFSAPAVVNLAKEAGMKYVVFTTKHHDGFAMFDSSLTEYKITSPQSPYGKDITHQLSDATHAAGLHWGVYYSQPDLHHPDAGKDETSYNRYFHGQVHELQTKYAPVDSVWFDGLGGSAKHWDSENLFAQMRRDNPNVLINDRSGLPGDYYTPEQRIGAYDDKRDWETCMTIGDQWAYKPDDNYKSSAQCIQALARCAGGDGNFLLNIGLRADGSIDPTQEARLRDIGAWMKANSASIYGTRGGPYKPARNYASTRRGSTVFLHLFNWNGDKVELPALPVKVRSFRALDGSAVEVKQSRNGLAVRSLAALKDSSDAVIALKIEGDSLAIPLIDPTRLAGKFSASAVYDANYGAEKAFDADPNTRWATPNGTKSAWLQMDLTQAQTVRGIVIDEAFAGRVRRFALEYQAPGSAQWEALLEGTGIGSGFKYRFKPVEMKAVRLRVLEASEGPTINEIELEM